MKLTTKLAAGAALSTLMIACGAAYAQETSSSIRGTVLTPGGAPAPGEEVTITDTRTGASRTVTTNAAGGFSARGLRVGGPYVVSVDSDSYQDESITDVFIELGDVYSVTFDLENVSAATDEIVITASAADVAQVAIGPSATFGLQDLQTLPAINRDIKDIIRTDPRIFVDEAFVDAIQCAGSNPRFNSLTVDGVRLNDNFGLNSNGFPTERIPFSYDSIEQVAVELAPFDVQYGGFSACNINAVTKAGTNEFHGGFFYDYTDDNLRGDSLEGEDVRVPEFDEMRYGATLGGPIIKDKLFFFASYEKLEGQNTFDRGPVGSGAINEVLGFSQSDFDEIQRIARDVYGYEPGGTPESIDNEDEKILVKLDWNITDNHRASFTYNYNDGFNNQESDGDADEFEFANHLYERGAELNSYVGSLYSDWTDSFSTEVRIGYVELDNRQITLGGTDFGEFQIGVTDGTNDATVYIGGDDSRQSNKLNYEVLTTVFKGFYQFNNHNFTFAYEREQLDVFNLFVQHTEGEYRFGSIADFAAGEPFRIEYANAPTGNPQDAAAEWGYSINTVYAQDEFLVPNTGLTITAGLRYDWYMTDDAPGENDDFVNDYGFSNSTNLDGEGLIQPRFGFNWEVNPAVTVRGGVGLYTGGNPNVWLSNNFSSNNELQFTVRDSDVGIDGTNLFNLTYVDAEDGTPGGPGYGIPAEMAAAVAGGGRNFEINLLDPDFELPSEWKFALGATYAPEVPMNNFLGGEYTLNGDLLWTHARNSAVVRRLDLEAAEPAVGGLLPQFESPNLDAFVLTNGEGAKSFNASFSVGKSYDFGLDWSVGYAYSEAEDESPMTSSVAFSNYNNRAYVDPNFAGVSTSNYNIRHRVTVQANWERAFFGDFLTKASLFGSINQGSPFSYTFINSNSLFGFTPFQDDDENPSLLYVPTGIDDPNVQFASTFDTDAFFAYVDANDLSEHAGGFAPRNVFEGDWWTKFDLKLEQEFPGVLPGHKTAAFVIIDNVGNLINDEWGILKETDFPGTVAPVAASLSSDNSQFVFEEFRPVNSLSRDGNVSLWSIRVGFKYDF
ncbi:MAG: TonB-dependent receptor [Pseudomonadota bacterium]